MREEHDHDSAGIAVLMNVLATAERDSRAAQAQLQDMTARFNTVSERVVSVVGGSAQGVDKELVQSLEHAITQTNRALSALGAAASSSRRSS